MTPLRMQWIGRNESRFFFKLLIPLHIYWILCLRVWTINCYAFHCFEQGSSLDIFENQPEKQKLCSWWNFKSIGCWMCLLRDRHSQSVIARCTAEKNIGEQNIHISTAAARLVMALKRGFRRWVKIKLTGFWKQKGRLNILFKDEWSTWEDWNII